MILLDNRFVKINEHSFLINLSFFSSGDDFSIDLLNFLSNYAIVRRNIKDDCQVFNIKFTARMYITNIPFIYPYIDKSISFVNIYEIYLYNIGTDILYMYINRR